MRTFPQGTWRSGARLTVVAGLLLAAAVSPSSASADTDLSIGGVGVIAYVNGDNVRLRTGPSYSDSIITLFPEGTTVDVLDGVFEANDGSLWYQVSVGGQTGYMDATYLADSNALLYATSGEAYARDALNIRSSAGLGGNVLATIPAGTAVTLTGENINGWLSVSVNGVAGYAYSAFLTQDGSAASSGDTQVAESSGVLGTRYTLDALNLRQGPGLDEAVLTVLPFAAQVELSGGLANGFAEVSTPSGSGWVAAEYLSPSAPEQFAETVVDAAESQAASLVVWPVSGGEWEVSQGYNGTSHVNRSDLWQYQYSLDLVRTDGSTAGQPVYAPVDGTIRWYDPSTGGVSIDMGNGLAYAMFHAEFDGGFQEGDQISQGEYLGYVSYPGGGGNGGFPHLHITVWETFDGGNWSRGAIPFTGAVAISGVEFPNSGEFSAHRGYTFYP